MVSLFHKNHPLAALQRINLRTTQYKNQLIFASSRGSGKKYGWNNQSFLDLFSAEQQEDGSYGKVIPLDSEINTKFHESTVAFTPDDAIMYFTRNNYFKKKYKSSEDGVNRLKIFKATLNDDDEWGDVESIPFNSNAYSVAHPTINVQGTKMYLPLICPEPLGHQIFLK